MTGSRPIRNALLSVYSKDGLEPIARQLDALGAGLLSTGGTQSFLESLGLNVTAVETLTSYPSILGGRVKTLHPKIFGGILARRGLPDDTAQLSEYDIPPIDLVVVDLYPFEETVASGAGEQDVIEKIDIGGISLIRAAAKNCADVLIVPSRSEYPFLLDLLESKKGVSETADRRKMAAAAFAVSSNYDSAIFNYFGGETPQAFRHSAGPAHALRYGENPHQKGVFYGDLDAAIEKLNGKEISYNNLLDIDAAIGLIDEFSEPAFAILKHNNACGLATRPSLADAWRDALAADPVSAFGGILIANREMDEGTATEINKLFFEVVIAPSYAPQALDMLRGKKNRIVLQRRNARLQERQFRTILNGVLAQQRDAQTETEADLKVVTRKELTPEQKADLIFAGKVVKHTKSNAIVLARQGQLLASGVGQTSRVDALKQAIAKAGSFGLSLAGAVMASDAFFPFPDCVEIAHRAGIAAVIQPGGSVKDQDSIDYCNSAGIAMAFTGHRHFRH